MSNSMELRYSDNADCSFILKTKDGAGVRVSLTKIAEHTDDLVARLRLNKWIGENRPFRCGIDLLDAWIRKNLHPVTRMPIITDESSDLELAKKWYASRLLRAEEQLASAEELIGAYRKQIPLGNQPHMIASIADAWLEAREKYRRGE